MRAATPCALSVSCGNMTVEPRGVAMSVASVSWQSHKLSHFKPDPPHNSAREQISRNKDLLRGNCTGITLLCMAAVPGSIALLAIVDCKDFLRQVCEALLVVLHGLLITQLKSTRRKPCDALLVVLHGLPIILQRLVLYILLYYNAWTEQAGSSRRS